MMMQLLMPPGPPHDDSALVKDSIQIVVQVNGKLRAKLDVAADITKDAMEAAAQADENVRIDRGFHWVVRRPICPGALVVHGVDDACFATQLHGAFGRDLWHM